MNEMDLKAMMFNSVLITFLLITLNWPTTTANSVCKGATSCKDCFEGMRSSSCFWLHNNQECLDMGHIFKTGDSVVKQQAHCPLVVSVQEGLDVYRVYVANDVAGLLRYLDREPVICLRGGSADGITTSVTITRDGVGDVICVAPRTYFHDDFDGFSNRFSVYIKRKPWRMPELKLVSYGPHRGWSNAAGTVLMSFTVRNKHKIDPWCKPVAVTMAGQLCKFVDHWEWPGFRDVDIMWCEVSISGLFGNESGPVIVYFSSEKQPFLDLSFTVRSMRYFRFDPIPEAGQRLSGLASGGTVFRVMWNDLTGVNKDTVTFYVRLDFGKRLLSRCRVATDTRINSMNCTAPIVPIPHFNWRHVCGFELEIGDERIDYPCDRFDVEYRAHVDPLFLSFKPIRDGSGSIVIYGRGLLDSGFGIEDVTVMLLDYNNMDEVRCNVYFIAMEKIECKPDQGGLIVFQKTIDSLKTISVAVGNAYPLFIRPA